MYSLTSTNIHSLHPITNQQPLLRVKCKCQRLLIQQQVYTCVSCSTYSCHYCTIPQFTSLQCRNCRANYQISAKNVKCKMCFACPYCQNILTVTKDPKTKLYIMLCQFCYWNSKQIKVKQERVQNLIDALAKLSLPMKEQQMKIYNKAYHFIKQTTNKVQRENHNFKYSYTSSKRLPASLSSLKNISSVDQSVISTIKKQQLENIEIKHCGLDQDEEEYKGEMQYPQALPLQAKKNRRCPQCKKQLTTSYRNRSNEHKVQLMHKDLKIIQCQINAPKDNKVKVKFLRQASLDEKLYKQDQIQEVEVEKQFKVNIKIVNRTKGQESNIQYTFIVQNPKKNKISSEGSSNK